MPEATLTMRHLVLDILFPLEIGKARRFHLEDALNSGFEKHGFSAEDRRFGTYLAYGIVRHWFALTHCIEGLSNLPLKKLDPKVRLLLKLGLFQLLAMDSVPPYAAVSSTMELATEVGLATKSRGFINALLQNAIRNNIALSTAPKDCMPDWWLQHLQQYYNPQALEEILASQAAIPAMSIRVNTLKTSVEAYQAQLEAINIPFTPSAPVPEVLTLTEAQGDPRSLPGYAEGAFLVQDESSARVVPFLNPQPGETVLEIGAAPGTKTTHLAACMQNQGHIVAVDQAAKRMEKLTANLERLGVSIADPLVADALTSDLSAIAPDKILIDAPCSGTGTLGKHPEILLTLQETELARHAQTQQALLENAWNALKPGGVLVYSTCSISPVENRQVVDAFLGKHTADATLETDLQILPGNYHDGFYMARLRKSR